MITHADKIELWLAREKGQQAAHSYDVADAPRAVYVEGLTVSDQPGDQSVTASYQWGSVQISDVVHITVVPKQGNSEAYLRIFKSLNEQTGELSDEVADNEEIGGTVYIAFYISIGPGERMTPGQAQVTVNVKDMYPSYEAGTDVDWPTALDLTTTTNWKVKTLAGNYNDATVPVASADNKDGQKPLVYRHVITWQPTKTLWATTESMP